jgi:hypothetical protein
MLNAIFKPLKRWPGTFTPLRKVAPFKAGHNQTLDLLEAELNHLGARNVVIQCQTTLSQLRNDGWMKATAAVSGPAVVLSFTGENDAQYSYPCDTFTEWTHNLRAIALSLEALRKVDRYGVTAHGEQYQGFKQLPPPAGEKKQMTAGEAAGWMAERVPGADPKILLSDQQYFETMLRLANKRMHPDQQADQPGGGGSHGDFIELQEAAAVITQHFKGK